LIRFIIFNITAFLLLAKLNVAQSISPSIKSGVYPSSFTLHFNLENEDVEIRYTNNGTEPTIESFLYSKEKGIFIEDQNGQENHFSNIPTTADSWIEPKRPVAKATIIWAQAYINKIPVEPPSISSYFVNLNYTFPIFSIVAKPQDLFSDSTGIFVPGDSYNAANNTNGNAGMRGREWERPVQIEFIENNKLVLQQNVGIRIHGLSSRALPQKSVRIYARNDYGKKYLEYPFFTNLKTEKFKRLILRSPGSDWSDTFFKDEMIHQIVKEKFDVDMQDYRPSILFINGEYWGIYNLRERQDEHYLSLKLNIDDDDINLLESGGEIIEGDNNTYLHLLQFVKENDISKNENYAYLQQQIDIQSFIDYHIIELFFANQDWPRHNFRYWQATKGDKRWRWLFFDCDLCMIFHHDDYFGVFLDNKTFNGFNRDGASFPEWSVILLKSLLKNIEFRKKFIAEFLEAASTTFTADKLIEQINSYEKLYAPEVEEHISRWGNPGNLDVWLNNVNDLRKFALHRPPFILQKFQEFVGSPFSIYPNPSINNFKIDCAFNSEEAVKVSVLSLTGQYILDVTFKNTTALNAHNFSMPKLSSGNYIVLFKYKQMRFSEYITIF